MPHLITVMIEQSGSKVSVNEGDENYLTSPKLVSDAREQLSALIPMLPGRLRPMVVYIINQPDLLSSQLNGMTCKSFTYYYLAIVLGTSYPNYQHYESRMQTFSGPPQWPLQNNLSPEYMSLWGFFRKEPSDKQHTCCFACGCVLSDWISDDNPYRGHSQFRPQCPWIMFMAMLEKMLFTMNAQHCNSFPQAVFDRRASSLHEVQLELPPEVVESRLKSLLNLHNSLSHPAEGLLDKGNQAVVICRDLFGYSIEDINFVLWRKLLRYFNTQKVKPRVENEIHIESRNLYVDAKTMIQDMLLHMEPSGSLFSIFPHQGGVPFVQCIQEELLHWSEVSSKVTTTASQENIPSGDARQGMETSENSSTLANYYSPSPVVTSLSSSNSSTTSSRRIPAMGLGANSSSKTPTLSESTKKALANRICVKCIRRPAANMCLPCKHLALCNNCVGTNNSEVRKCPACSSEVKEVVQVITS